jgi:hypothetical protein
MRGEQEEPMANARGIRCNDATADVGATFDSDVLHISVKYSFGYSWGGKP